MPEDGGGLLLPAPSRLRPQWVSTPRKLAPDIPPTHLRAKKKHQATSQRHLAWKKSVSKMENESETWKKKNLVCFWNQTVLALHGPGPKRNKSREIAQLPNRIHQKGKLAGIKDTQNV